MKYFHRVYPYLKPYWKLAVVSVVLLVVSVGLGLLAPWPLQILIDHVLGQKPFSAVLGMFFEPLVDNRYALLIVAVVGGLLITILLNAVKVFSKYISTRIDQHMVLDFRSDLFEHAQRLSLSFHDQRRTGRVIFAINNLGAGIAKLVMAIPPLAQSFLTLIGMFCIVLLLDWQIAFVSLAIVPLLYYSVAHYMKHVEPQVRQVRGMEAEMLSIIHEAMSMLRVIVAFGREDHEHRRFRDHGTKTVGERVKLTVRQTMFSLVVNSITAVGTAMVLGIGAWHVMQGKLMVGELLVVMFYIAAVYAPLETISTTIGSLQEVSISLEGAFKLLDSDAEIKDVPGAKPLERCHGRVTFARVNFAYKERSDTLQDISLEVEPGQLIGIAGPTGAGKTTLVSVLPRFYEPQQGQILIDGNDIRDVTLKSLREQFGIVLQEPLLFSATIAENIRYGRFDATMEEILAAAQAANAHDFIMRLPKKYDTKLGEKGAKLSGGERQRISVARAFLKDAPILILDEPTSSVDMKTESLILDALERLMLGRTTFLITHRLSSLQHADQILVMDRGAIVDRGRHDELLRRPGLYKQLHDASQKRRKQLGHAAATTANA